MPILSSSRAACCLTIGAIAASAMSARAQPGTPASGADPAQAAQVRLWASERRPSLEIDLLGVRQTRNDVQVPGDTGSRFPLDSLTSNSGAAVRIEGVWPIARRDELRVLLAPLSVDGRGSLGGVTNFAGTAFAPGEASADYRFDSYRLTWRRAVVDTPDWSVKLGVTAKIRSAEIELRQGGLSASKRDVGLVPLLHAVVERRLGDRLSLVADIDALGASQGRAIDAGLRLRWAIDRDWAASVVYRVLDGGADNDEVYNFARFHFLGVGLRRAF